LRLVEVEVPLGLLEESLKWGLRLVEVEVPLDLLEESLRPQVVLLERFLERGE
jgi:hypothetical protein